MDMSSSHNVKRLWLSVGCRIHLGQLDLCGSLGRIYGGLGLALENPQIKLTAQQHEGITLHTTTRESEEALDSLVSIILNRYGLPGIEIWLEEELPTHVGLGSGTQIALAVGFAILKVYGLETPTAELALITNRGDSRSGVGVASFDHGGFIVDGGKSYTKGTGGESSGFGEPDEPGKSGEPVCGDEVPPPVAQIPFPEQWRVILAIPKIANEKMYGKKEKNAFSSLAPMTEEMSGSLCRRVIMNILPALKLQDLVQFGQGISAVQAMLGDYFTPVQGGRYCNKMCEDLAQLLTAHGAVGVGQSSWGPSIYGFTDADHAADLCSRAEKFLEGNGSVQQVSGRNHGVEWGWLE